MKPTSPAADRNKLPIFEVLNPYLRPHSTIFEIASGTAQHALFMAQQRADIRWLPSERDASALAVLRECLADVQPENISEPIVYDVAHSENILPIQSFDALININMLHISPWSAGQALFLTAAKLLKKDAVLFLYGPFFIPELPTSPSNLEFDQSLKSRDASWGIRNLPDVTAEAEGRGLRHLETVVMPANNYAVIFRNDSGSVS